MAALSPSAVCIGECMIELSEARDGTLTRSFGGDTLNTALYLARLGVPTSYATALGDDPFSDAMLAAWLSEGVGTGLVLRVPGRLPGLYLIRTDDAGERRFHYWRDAAPVRQLMAHPELARVADAIAQARLVYFSGVTLSLFDPPGRDRLFALLEAARGAGARVAFDTNFRPRGWPDLTIARAAFARARDLSTIVLASVEDHAGLHGTADAAALRAWLDPVPEAVLRLSTPECHVIAPGCDAALRAVPVPDVLDTTAAGDSFAAAYLAARLGGSDPLAAAAAGHRLAGAVVRHKGAIIPRAAMPARGAAA